MKVLNKLLLVGLVMVFIACNSDEEERIYMAPVQFKVDVTMQDSELNAPMRTKSFTHARLKNEYVGYGGLLIVCSASHITGTIYQLFAYDLACTNERNKNIRVEPDNEGKATCPECGTVYDIFNGNGNVISDPSKSNLQVYRNVTHDSKNTGVFNIEKR